MTPSFGELMLVIASVSLMMIACTFFMLAVDWKIESKESRKRHDEFIEYCKQDVETTKALYDAYKHALFISNQREVENQSEMSQNDF